MPRRPLGERALQRIGYSTEEARVIAAHVVESELMGYPALGLTRVLTIAEHPRTKQPRKAVNIVRETPVSALVDCGNYVGMHAIHRVAEIAIGKARTGGFAVVGAHNTFLSGRNAYYLDMIARFGFVGVHLASGQPVVAPLGGSAPAFGTNPIAFGIPREPHPVIFDMGTAAVNHGDLVLASWLGRELPEGVALDAQGGRPATPPRRLPARSSPRGTRVTAFRLRYRRWACWAVPRCRADKCRTMAICSSSSIPACSCRPASFSGSSMSW